MAEQRELRRQRADHGSVCARHRRCFAGHPRRAALLQRQLGSHARLVPVPGRPARVHRHLAERRRRQELLGRHSPATGGSGNDGGESSGCSFAGTRSGSLGALAAAALGAAALLRRRRSARAR
ncbi:MYXO-CTERM sorting domain-containing protein [Sorangium sp. So ce260]|uniref:MYXO-CTERM sorting domain-containing protein n=1 Tax=Sorangium sp. So ce260 TaxID=3133291 RepID=UPI003F5F3A75